MNGFAAALVVKDIATDFTGVYPASGKDSDEVIEALE